MKKILVNILKLAVSGITAGVILSAFSLIYYNPPVAVPQPDKTTNSKFEENKSWSVMTEGFGYGKTDSSGYNNSYYDGCTDPDVVVIGSSQTEALQVGHRDNFVYLLNEKLATDTNADNDLKCINRGIAAHFFSVLSSNYKYVAEQYKDADYIVIEVGKVLFDAKSLDKMVEGGFHSDLEPRGKLYTIAQNIPAFRLLRLKISEFLEKDGGAGGNAPTENDIAYYSDKMNLVLADIAKTSEQYGIKPIILYHNTIDIDKNTATSSKTAQEYYDAFAKCCEQNGIELLNATEAFADNYEKTYELPYGYSNTTPGTGHLNVHGHRVIAELLYDRFNGMEGENR